MYLSKKEKITKPYVVSVIMLLRLQQNEHDVLGWVQYVWSCITAFHACMISVMAAPWSQFHDLLTWKWISASCCIIGTFDFFYLFWCNLSASDKNTKHFFWFWLFPSVLEVLPCADVKSQCIRWYHKRSLRHFL